MLADSAVFLGCRNAAGGCDLHGALRAAHGPAVPLSAATGTTVAFHAGFLLGDRMLSVLPGERGRLGSYVPGGRRLANWRPWSCQVLSRYRCATEPAYR